ncbi:MAG: nucleoside monophosphate kinase [archaeon]|nr:nucleoside monophosphate kinase [archaeon]
MSTQKKFKIIFVLGAPGGGKNTQCDLIKAKYKIFHFSCGELLRAAVQEKDPEADLINQMMKDGLIVPARITCSLQKKAMIKNSGKYETYLCDGFPRNEENLNVFLDTFKEEIQILGVLFIDCPYEECKRRISLRSGGRIDDNEESLKKRFKVMNDETIPNLENLKKHGPVFMINGNQEVNKVFKDIEDNIKDLIELQ